MSRPSDLETAMSNMNALVSLAVDLLIENMDCPQHGKHHLLPAAQSNQIVSLLVAARDYGEFQFKNRDGGAA